MQLNIARPSREGSSLQNDRLNPQPTAVCRDRRAPNPMLTYAIALPATSFSDQLDTLADSGELAKYVIEIDGDLVCFQAGRDDDIVQLR
jgi:hypothetical protein